MDGYKALTSINTTLGIAMAAALGKLVGDSLVSLGAPQSVSWAANLVLIPITTQFFRFLVDIMLTDRTLVRRLLLGRRFVEGDLYNVVKQEGQTICVGAISIQADGGSIRLNGEDFTLYGESTSSFCSTAVVLDWPLVKFHYSAPRTGVDRPDSNGVGRWHVLEAGNGPPTRHRGFFVDLFDNQRYDVEGRRVPVGSDVVYRLRDATTRDETIRAILDEFP